MTYGADTYCYDQIYTGRTATGVELVAQALYRRLTTPRGTLDDGEEGSIYGLDFADFVGTIGTDAAVAALPGVVLAEILKDDRVETADVRASATRDSAGLVNITVEIDVFLQDSSEAFTLSISVSDVTVALLGVTPL